MVYTSKQNPLIKSVKALSEKKYRRSSGRFIVEGEKMSLEAVAMGLPVVYLIATEKQAVKHALNAENVIITSDAVMEFLSEQKQPEGMLAVIEMPADYQSTEDLLGGNIILLDGVSDPGNLGTIIRTAAACGVEEVLLCGCADPYSYKSLRASMSGIYRCRAIECERERAFELIGGRKIIVADMDGESIFGEKNVEKTKGSFCLVIGGESHGVSEIFRERADRILSIPMRSGVESLNAAISCGIIIYNLIYN